jgi:hypothetical protein
VLGLNARERDTATGAFASKNDGYYGEFADTRFISLFRHSPIPHSTSAISLRPLFRQYKAGVASSPR